MLDITIHGFYVGAPYDLAAAGALVSWGGAELARLGESYRDGSVRSALGAELRVLAAALDWARGHGGMGEVVTVHSCLGELGVVCRGRGRDPDPEIRDLLERMGEIAPDFDGIHVVIAEGRAMAPVLEEALRSVLAMSRSLILEKAASEKSDGGSLPTGERERVGA